MVVEDEGLVALQIKETLENLGYVVPVIALSGLEAVTRVSEGSEPDLILMDIQLKGEMNGIQAAKRIHAAIEVPVVYLTAYSDPETLRMAELTDPYGYLLKPFDERSLHAAIQMALLRSKRFRQAQEREMWISAIPASLTEAVVICDAKGHVKFVNPAAETLLGTRMEQASDKMLYELLSLLDPVSRKRAQLPVSLPLMEGKSTVKAFVLLTADGKEISVDVSASPLRSVEGTLFGILFLFRNKLQPETMELVALRELDALFEAEKKVVPSRGAKVGDLRIDYFFHPSGRAGGDAIGVLPVGDAHIIFYALHIVGHRGLSTLFSSILGRLLSTRAGGIILAADDSRVLSPVEVVKELARRFYLKGATNPYFTLAYGVLDVKQGVGRMARAGYPPLFLIQASGVKVVSPEGYAVGLFPESEVHAEEFALHPGDSLVLTSDGLIDCAAPDGRRFTAKRLIEILEKHRNLPLRDAVDAADQAFISWRAKPELDEDATMLAIHREGAAAV